MESFNYAPENNNLEPEREEDFKSENIESVDDSVHADSENENNKPDFYDFLREDVAPKFIAESLGNYDFWTHIGDLRDIGADEKIIQERIKDIMGEDEYFGAVRDQAMLDEMDRKFNNPGFREKFTIGELELLYELKLDEDGGRRGIRYFHPDEIIYDGVLEDYDDDEDGQFIDIDDDNPFDGIIEDPYDQDRRPQKFKENSFSEHMKQLIDGGWNIETIVERLNYDDFVRNKDTLKDLGASEEMLQRVEKSWLE